MNYPCLDCGRRFGGVEAYNRHLDRRGDRCKTQRQMRKIGMHPDINGVWRRQPIAPQVPLIDKRSIPRKARTTRRVDALAGAEPPPGTNGRGIGSGLPGSSEGPA